MNERNGKLIRQKYREFLIPLLLTNLAFSVGSLFEDILVGHFLTDDALSAMAVASPAILCIDLILLVFSVGGTTCATISLGKMEHRRSNLIFTLSLLGSMVTILLFCFLAEILIAPITAVLADGDAEIARLTVLYLRPALIAGPFKVFACVAAAFISADGRPRYTCIVIITANLVLLLLNYLLICRMKVGISGAGLAVLGGNVTACIMVIPYLCKKQNSFRFTLPGFRDLKLFVSVLKSGFNSGWDAVSSLISNSFLIILILLFISPECLPILVVCMNILLVVDIVIDGTTDTLLPIAASLYGEQDYFGIRQIVKTSLKVLIPVSTAIAILFLLLPGYAGAAFGINTPEVTDMLKPAIRLYSLCLPFYALSSFLQSFYNTINRKSLSLLLTLNKNLLFIIPAALILVNIKPELIWLSFFLAEALALLVICLYSRKIQRKNGLQDILLLPRNNPNARYLDFTIVADACAADELVHRIIEFGRSSGIPAKLINHVAVAVEEMSVASAHYAHRDTGKGLIDILIMVTEERINVRLRDNGRAFNPVEYTPPKDSPCVTDGIELLRKTADSIHYSRRLGFNTTMLTFFRGDKSPQPNAG